MSYNFRKTMGLPASAPASMSTITSLNPLTRKHGDEHPVSTFASVRATPFGHDRDTVVNRLLDWAEQARSHGREDRAETLTLMAWEAYERPG